MERNVAGEHFCMTRECTASERRQSNGRLLPSRRLSITHGAALGLRRALCSQDIDGIAKSFAQIRARALGLRHRALV
jgi:hypothetical protein